MALQVLPAANGGRHSTAFADHSAFCPVETIYPPRQAIYPAQQDVYPLQKVIYQWHPVVYLLHPVIYEADQVIYAPEKAVYHPQYPIYDPHQAVYDPEQVIYTPQQDVYWVEKFIYSPEKVILRLAYQFFQPPEIEQVAKSVAKKRQRDDDRQGEWTAQDTQDANAGQKAVPRFASFVSFAVIGRVAPKLGIGDARPDNHPPCIPMPKAAINRPQSKRIALARRHRDARSVWTAVSFSAAVRTGLIARSVHGKNSPNHNSRLEPQNQTERWHFAGFARAEVQSRQNAGAPVHGEVVSRFASFVSFVVIGLVAPKWEIWPVHPGIRPRHRGQAVPFAPVPVAQASAPASSRRVSRRGFAGLGSRGETPPEPAGADACATILPGRVKHRIKRHPVAPERGCVADQPQHSARQNGGDEFGRSVWPRAAAGALIPPHSRAPVQGCKARIIGWAKSFPRRSGCRREFSLPRFAL